ncbi:hypothetical protein GXW74_06795 [Roseomonas eburnea]|uniref:Uncharacterized protein n=2 Tax=Neoroseomonas eburnea TaxID=1346889 RepID=A0A9X9X901_9PROT|nr:hypothetical protein [Neoroseomonas eburnea]
MRIALMLPALAALFVVPALAQEWPRRLGEFGAWTAAVHSERGQKMCFAFTRAQRMSHPRSEVVLSVTHRARMRDQVAIASGYTYPRNAAVSVAVGRTQLPFFTEDGAAYARDGRRAVAAFRGGSEAVARGPRAAGRRGTVTDSFSLRGFSAAYAAISRECPPRRRGR